MKITLDRSKCIGCGSCVAVCPRFFEMTEDGKSHLINSQRDVDEIDILVVPKIECIKDAAEVCPVQIIKVEG